MRLSREVVLTRVLDVMGLFLTSKLAPLGDKRRKETFGAVVSFITAKIRTVEHRYQSVCD